MSRAHLQAQPRSSYGLLDTNRLAKADPKAVARLRKFLGVPAKLPLWAVSDACSDEGFRQSVKKAREP